MNPDWLLKHFEQISEAPDAIPRLRRFILDLAVRGKLVEQNPKDEPAVELLKHAQTNRGHGSNGDKRQNQKLYPQIQADEIAPQIPENWILARVGELLNIQYGKALPAADRNDEGSVTVYGSNGVVGYCETALAQEPTIIIGRKGSAGALNLCEGPSWTTDVAYFLIPPTFFSIHFLFVALQTLDLDSLGKGVKPGLNRSEAYQLPMVVPPLAEQQRIVAKVDELMALCDKFEATQAKRERRRDRLVAATLHGLNNGNDSPEPGGHPIFEESARFYFNYLPRLTTRPEHIRQLRQTILNLAVRGKLVPQDPKDEPAEELLKRIKAEQERRIKDDQVKKKESFSQISQDELPFETPKHWQWISLCEIGTLTGGMTPSTNRSDFWEGDINWFSPKDIKSDELLSSELKISSAALKETGLQLYPPGCLFIVARSGILKRTFPVSINRVPAAANQDLKVLNPFIQDLDRYLQIMFRGMTEFILSTLVKTGMTVQSLKYSEFECQPFPLPPLAEQQRIVAKVDELMTLCDEFEARVTTTATTRRQLLEASLARP